MMKLLILGGTQFIGRNLTMQGSAGQHLKQGLILAENKS
jgi:nucleoside-diphosphate-sugar epimerase